MFETVTATLEWHFITSILQMKIRIREVLRLAHVNVAKHTQVWSQVCLNAKRFPHTLLLGPSADIWRREVHVLWGACRKAPREGLCWGAASQRHSRVRRPSFWPLVPEHWGQAARAGEDVLAFLLNSCDMNHQIIQFQRRFLLVSFSLGPPTTERIWVPHCTLC